MKLGVGLDLPWSGAFGLRHDPARGDHVSDRVIRFLQRYGARFDAAFFSWQPRDRGCLDLARAAPAYDDLMQRAPPIPRWALHHTALNLGAADPGDRAALMRFTNALIARYGLAWVNEDLGIWALGGRPLPYPLPPLLTDAGLQTCIQNTRAVAEALDAPLRVEFPGFQEGTSLVIGRWHAYDHFREVVEGASVDCTLDVGHLLSYQWTRGRRGEDLYAELERLPLDRCVELHLSGCRVDGGRFLDLHHGVLLDEQLTLTERLIALCPALELITYEDPRFDREGQLIAAAQANFERLERLVEAA